MDLWSYIRRNKWLFTVSIIIFIQFILACIVAVWAHVSSIQFQYIKTSQSSINSNFNFWEYVWRSGEVMSTYGNISRTKGYQQDSTNLIQKLFTGNSSGSISSSSALVEPFEKFNLAIQMAVATICVIGFLGVFNLLIICLLIWKYLLVAQLWNFRKLLWVIFLNVIGFLKIYYSEKFGSPDLSISPTLSQIRFIRNTKNLKNNRQIFNLTQTTDHPLIEIKNLNFSHHNKSLVWGRKNATTQILKDINLQIPKGSFTVIIGPNGSGKTTLLKTLINLYENFTGEILWNGRRISEINRTDFARQVSYIPQFLNLKNSISVLDFLEFARYPYRQLNTNSPEVDKELVVKAIEKNRCEKLKNRVVNELSGGQKQKIILTSVLVQESEVIVLDEPTSYLDIKNQHEFLEVLANFHSKGKTIIMILHDLRQSIKYADNLIVLHDGCIKAAGHPRDVVSKELFRDVFRIDCDISYTPKGIELNNAFAL